MSKNNMGYMGNQIGKLGTAVGTIFRRQQIYRAHQKFVRNPQTSRQQMGRLRFSVLSGLSRAFAPGIALGLGTYARQRGGYYRPTFLGLNYGAVIVSNPEEVSVDYSALVIAAGSTPGVYFERADYQTPQQVSVPFSANVAAGGALESDLVYLFAFSPSLDTGILSVGTPRGTSSGTATITLPAQWSGESVHLYGFVRNSLTEPTWVDALQTSLLPGIASDSTYLGQGTVA